MRAKLVENIEFKRGIGSKEALGVGFMGMPYMFSELFKMPLKIEYVEFEIYGANKTKGIDYISFKMDRDVGVDNKLIRKVDELGLGQFLSNPEINKNHYDKTYIEYNVKNEFKSLFLRFINNFGSQRSTVSKVNDTLYPADLNESVEFKRGIGSKRSLGMGYQGLIEMFETLLEFPGLIRINLWGFGEKDPKYRDFMEIIYKSRDPNLKEHLSELGFDRFITTDLVDGEYQPEETDEPQYITTTDIKPEYHELFGRFSQQFAMFINPKKSFMVPQEQVKESINFKRGTGTRKGLEVGMDYIFKFPFRFDLFPDGEYEVLADDTYKKSRERPEDYEWNTRIEVKGGKVYQIYMWQTEFHDSPKWMEDPVYLPDPDHWVKTNDVKTITPVD